VSLTQAEQVASQHGPHENPGVNNRRDELWSLLGLDRLMSGLAGHPESVI